MTAWTRRRFVTASATTVAGALTMPGWLSSIAAGGGPRLLRRGVGLIGGGGGTIGWLATPDALVVVDSQFPDPAREALRNLRGRTERAPGVLINTHHHGDHTAGNPVFAAAGAELVAHRSVPRLQRDAATRRGNDPDAETVPSVAAPSTPRSTSRD